MPCHAQKPKTPARPRRKHRACCACRRECLHERLDPTRDRFGPIGRRLPAGHRARHRRRRGKRTGPRSPDKRRAGRRASSHSSIRRKAFRIRSLHVNPRKPSAARYSEGSEPKSRLEDVRFDVNTRPAMSPGDLQTDGATTRPSRDQGVHGGFLAGGRSRTRSSNTSAHAFARNGPKGPVGVKRKDGIIGKALHVMQVP